MMQLLGPALFTLIALLHGASGQYNPYARPTSNPLIGQPCDRLPVGFRRNTCGTETVLNTQEQPLPVFKYGPNVCRVTETVHANELEYVYSQHCYWVFSHRYYSWVQQCQLACVPTRNCLTDRNTTFVRDRKGCCSGFSTRPSDIKKQHRNPYTTLYTPISTVPTGCPVAVADTLLECLEIQGLNTFTTMLLRSRFEMLLNTTGVEVTVFAPTDEAFEEQFTEVIEAIINAPGGTADELVGFHLVNGTVNFTKILTRMRYDNLAGSLLHGATVTQFTLNPGYSTNPYRYQPSPYGVPTEERFINGAGIVVRDACKTPNGTLHIVDRVLIPSNDTIADVLRSQPRFSNFTDLLDTVNILRFLENPSISRTVFAFTNDVLQAAFPPDLLDCLTTYMRRPLNDLLLFHLSDRVDYNSSIVRQQWLETLLLKHISVTTFPNGSVFLTEEMVEIVETDIEARTGVIHVVDGILLPPNFDFGKCQMFVPTTPPPTTAPPTTEPPSPSPSPSPSPQPLPSPSPTPSVGGPGGEPEDIEVPGVRVNAQVNGAIV